MLIRLWKWQFYVTFICIMIFAIYPDKGDVFSGLLGWIIILNISAFLWTLGVSLQHMGLKGVWKDFNRPDSLV